MAALFNDEKVLYSEVQQYRQQWLWVLLIFSTIMSLLPVTLITLTGKKDVKAGLIVAACILIFEAINIILFYKTKFETIVTAKGIYYRWWPFFRKYTFINRADIERVSFEKWTNTQWGFSKSEKYGRAHTVNGDKGILIELKDGRKYYIGSQDALLLQTACEKMVSSPERFA